MTTKDRRSLVEGLSTPPVQRAAEKQFVFAEKVTASEPSQPTAPAAQTVVVKAAPVTEVTRVPFTTRLRTDFAAALKRASLERQLSKTTPNTLQDILEEALEPWLIANGYLN
ncbi:MAG TPA: hypothetical protein VGY66_27225 [Gemmataceae bacterium]|jgi:hypothetical protein|nr:hypothetical protein [Gemmataceae bacterium]